MKTRALLTASLPALLLADVTAAAASGREVAIEVRRAAKLAAGAERALGKQDMGDAVARAERAVALSPRDAGHRALLGRAYLQAGRFESARTTLEEALQLGPLDARAALNLVLAEIATGDWPAARRTLNAHADQIPASDRGLAIALLGDPAAAVELLMAAARQPGAAPKTRQNLALSLALAGQWRMARAVAAADLAPGEVDARMVEWAGFVRPGAPSDQVAHLLGVRAAADAGRPVALALNAPAAPVAVAEAAPVVTIKATVPAPRPAAIVFAPPKEVVQPLPVRTIRPAPVVAKVAASPAPRSGTWYIQLGAFDSAGVAKDAWSRATRRFAAFRERTPMAINSLSNGRGFYRLSVGGFANDDARAMCERYRTTGGACFVRLGEGDQVAHWLRKPGVRVASR